MFSITSQVIPIWSRNKSSILVYEGNKFLSDKGIDTRFLVMKGMISLFHYMMGIIWLGRGEGGGGGGEEEGEL